MRAGAWPNNPVRAVTARAILNGQARDVDSLSVKAQMTAELPALDGASSAVADGSVDWPQQEVVAATIPHPFLRSAGSTWPPVTGSSIALEVGDGLGQWWRQITGLVDSTTGGLDDPTVSSAVIDYVDRLSAKVFEDALLASMPPVIDGSVYRRVGLTGTYVTDLCARAAGFYATSPMTTRTRLSAPCMGSLWPERGSCNRADTWTDPGTGAPNWKATSWGLAAWDVNADWQLTSPAELPELTVSLTDQALGDSQTVALVDDNGVGVAMQHAADDTLRIGFRTPGQDLVNTIDRAGVEKAAVRVTLAGTTLTVTLMTADDRTITASSTNATFSGWTATRCLLQGPGAMGGVLVENNQPVPWTSVHTTPTAIMKVTSIPWLQAMPALNGDTALDLLTEQAAAVGASMWIDSLGRLRWQEQGSLERRAAITTKTTDLTIDGMSWVDDYSRVRSQITIKRREPAISRFNYPGVLLWQSNDETLAAGQELVSWLEPPADTDWLMVDDLHRVLNTTTGSDIILGSWYSAILVGTAADSDQDWASNAQYNATLVRVGQVYKLTQDAGTLPSGRTVATKTLNDAPNLPKSWRGRSMPILRGKARVDWSDQTTVIDTGATAAIASYEHDSGWWVQDGLRQAGLAAWLTDRLAAPQPQITAVQIDADPRLELGDKVTLIDPHRTGLTIDLVITSIDQGYGSDAPTMTLAGRVTRVEQTYTVSDPASSWQALLDGWTTTAGGTP
ncbi:hypothetical protein [uncultured Friedmanniella sp.]|uniref:hypothetical protein n=1 Tax=uncultured Friedmanniella sp. TaxID=335381 RepID=UPI0035CC172D